MGLVSLGNVGVGNPSFAIGGVSSPALPSFVGGPCEVWASAGSYAVSVQFLAASGSVTVKNRKLWCKAEAFA